VTETLKRFRNALSDAAAGCALLSPGAERLFIRGARVLVRSRPLYGIARRAMQTLSARLRERGDTVRLVQVGEASFLIDVTGDVLREMYFANLPCEPRTTKWLLANLGPGQVFVDVGANVGYYSLLAAQLVGPRGRVVAFEPNVRVRARLEDHVRWNRVGDIVTVVGAALADVRDGALDLFVPERDEESGIASLHRTPLLEGKGATAMRVPSQRLDDWLEGSSLPRINVMKIDVEGAEARVLEGMRRTLLSRRPPHIVCETRWDSPAHRLLLAAGYKPAMLDRFDSGEGVANVLYTSPPSRIIDRRPSDRA
jgi:FkbM family methyltransferase